MRRRCAEGLQYRERAFPRGRPSAPIHTHLDRPSFDTCRDSFVVRAFQKFTSLHTPTVLGAHAVSCVLLPMAAGAEDRPSLGCDDVTPSGSSGSAGNHPSPAAQGEPTAIITFSTQCSESRRGARCAPSPGASPQLSPPCGLRRRGVADPAWEGAGWSASLLPSPPDNRPLRVIGKLTDPLRSRAPPRATATSLAARAHSLGPPEATALASSESGGPGRGGARVGSPPAPPHATLRAAGGRAAPPQPSARAAAGRVAPARAAVLALPTALFRRNVAFTPGSSPLLLCPAPHSCASRCASSRSSCRIRCRAESRGRSLTRLSSAKRLPLFARARAHARPAAGEPPSESAFQLCSRPAAGSHAS